MIEVGDKVRVDGKIVTVVSRYAAGKHIKFCLDDGDAILNLHLRDDVEVIGVCKPVADDYIISVPPEDDEPSDGPIFGC